MARFTKLLGAVFIAFGGSAHAGYALLSAPAGWSSSSGSATYVRGAANAAQFASGTVRTSAALSVAGRAIAVPVALRVAANASTYAARFMFMNPYVLTAAGIAFLVAHNINWDELSQRWVHADPSAQSWPTSDGYEYSLNYNNYFATPSLACDSKVSASQTWAATNDPARQYFGNIVPGGSYGICSVGYVRGGVSYPESSAPLVRRVGSCPVGWYITDQGCVQTAQPSTVPQTEDEFVTRVAPQIQPEVVPDYLPYTVPIPVDPFPVVNPSDDPSPSSRPFLIPVADPVPVPNTNPQQYTQPFIQVVPSPTSGNPWQVDVTPVERTSTDPTALRDPVTDPGATGSVDPAADPDLCAGHPDILACQTEIHLGELDAVPFYNEDRQLDISADVGQTAECPAPVQLDLGFTSLSLSYDLVCRFADMVRPLFIAFAWLTSAATFLGVSRRGA